MKDSEKYNLRILKLKRFGRILLFPFRLLIVYFRSRPSPYCANSKAFADYIKEKTVVIVGPDSGLIGKGQGRLIDSYDVVIRINHALPIPPEFEKDLGTRTDILYHNTWIDSQKALPPEEFIPIVVKSVDWLISTRPYMHLINDKKKGIDIFNSLIADQIKFKTVSPRRYLNHCFKMKTNINAGISAIQDLIQYELKKLFITGFSFYQTSEKYYKGYRGSGSVEKVHKQSSQMSQMKRWVEMDQRIEIDATLQNILYNIPT